MPNVANLLSLSSLVKPPYEIFSPFFTFLTCKIGIFKHPGKFNFILFLFIIIPLESTPYIPIPGRVCSNKNF